MNSRCAKKRRLLGSCLIALAVWFLPTVIGLAAAQFEEAWKRTENRISPNGFAVDGNGSVVLTAQTDAGAVILKVNFQSPFNGGLATNRSPGKPREL